MLSDLESLSSGLQVAPPACSQGLPPTCRMQLTAQQAPGLPTTWLQALQMLRRTVAQPWTVHCRLRHPHSSSRELGPHLSGVDRHKCCVLE